MEVIKQEMDIQQEIIRGYNIMELLPGIISRWMEEYIKNVKLASNRHQNNVQHIEKEYNGKCKAADTKYANTKSDLSNDHAAVVGQLQALHNQMSSVNDAYLKTMGMSPQKASDDIMDVLMNIRSKQKYNYEQFMSTYTKLSEQEEAIYKDKLAHAEQLYQKQSATILQEYKDNLQREDNKYRDELITLYQNAQNQIYEMEPEKLSETYSLLQTSVPRNKNYETAKVMPESVEIGYVSLQLEEWRRRFTEISRLGVIDRQPTVVGDLYNFILEAFSFAYTDYLGASVLQFPVGRAFCENRFSKLVIYKNASERENALDYLRALEMRLFMHIPCGKLRVTMFDPVDLGSNFSMFSCLGDDDERIISTKIWSDPKRIKEQLNYLISQIEHVNQDCLRNDFDNIIEYNKFVGKNAEPLQVLFVADYPKHFDEESCALLTKVISSGQKCGIYTFIAAEEYSLKGVESAYGAIPDSVERIHCGDVYMTYRNNNEDFLLAPIVLPEKSEQIEIFESLINGIKTSDRITITFDEITNNLTSHPEKWFQFSDENGLDIPIGLEGASRTVQIHLGGQLITQHHALISGTIGSGKSTLLHTIIMSTLLHYSPEDVQIYLLDFKRGVEFKLYAESQLPNFRVISLETEPEFGYAALRHLEQEQADRAQEFHDKGCDNIETYNEIAASNMNDDIEKLPRILVIIDEFHELFANPEAEITKECEQLLEQIIRQGRAMGIHVILASQTLPDNLSRIYGQILNRIALQSTSSSAQYILDPDNDAVNTLVDVDAGKGIFNNAGGGRDANHPFRVAFFKDEEQKELLHRLKSRQEEVIGNTWFEKPRLLLSSIQDDMDNPLNRFVEYGEIPKRRELGCPLYLGEEIAMVNDFSVRLTSRPGQNLLILGSDNRRANRLYSFAGMSILFNEIRQSVDGRLPEEPIITFFDFGTSRNQTGRLAKNSLDIMNELSANFPETIQVFGRDSLMDGLDELERIVRGKYSRKHYVIFAGLNRARRLLDGGRAYEKSPRDRFVELVKNGPENGMNFIIWANEPSSFCSFYSDLISECDYRLVYNLKEEEYEQVVKSSQMDTTYGNNVIAYNPDDENKKVRIYSLPLLSWFKKFMTRLMITSDDTVENKDFFSEDSEWNDEFGEDFE